SRRVPGKKPSARGGVGTKAAAGNGTQTDCPMPAWLRLDHAKNEFNVYEARATIVRAIFEDSAAGIRDYSIARRLNRDQIPVFGRSRGWQTSYVTKIL